MRGLGVIAVMVAGCYSPRPAPGAPCNPDGDCPAPFTCVNEICVDESDGDDVIDAAMADSGDELLDAEMPDAAPDGTGLPLAPYLPPAFQEGGTVAWVVATDVTVDTTMLSSSSSEIEVVATPQLDSDGPELAVIQVGSLQIMPGAEIRVTGTRPLVIVAAGDISVAGVINASARLGASGPGGNAMLGAGAGLAGITDGPDDSGGGGGGNGTMGAAGGTSGPAPGGLGGVALATMVLRGGGAGGTHTMRNGCPAPTFGGGGGGALVLVARGAVSLTGRIEVNGGGGPAAPPCPVSSLSGAGGGAGGTLVVMAAGLTFSTGAILTANGGGGSAGAMSAAAGVPGEDGRDDTTVALGGMGGGSIGGRGGAGGANTTAPGDGQDVTNGGGGGGAVGWIIVRTPVGIQPIVPASPPAVYDHY